MDQFTEATIKKAKTEAVEDGIPIGVALVYTEGQLFATGWNRKV